MGNMAVESAPGELDLLLEKVHRDSGRDFRDYKQGTVVRRLERRLQATGARTYLEYIQFLDAHPEEYKKLTDYLTIAVSGFFRNPYAFQQVAGLVLPELMSYKREQGERSLRVWSTACARGEEPYSIAIRLADFLGNQLEDFNVSIYATDVNRQVLTEAKAGTYSQKDAENLPPGVLERYFIHHGNGYAIRADIRQMVYFSYFDLASTTTPPFVELDCVFCCNVLLYLQKQLQERVLDMLYSSLNSPGYLILGEVETPTGSLCEKLECLDTRARVYKKKGRGGKDV